LTFLLPICGKTPKALREAAAALCPCVLAPTERLATGPAVAG
jgi:hypothetical protein